MEDKNKYEDLSWLIGMGLTMVRGPVESHLPDGRVRIAADYPETVLLEMEYKESRWGLQMKPRWIRLLVPKASLYCGDVLIKVKSTRQMITGEVVRARVRGGAK